MTIVCLPDVSLAQAALHNHPVERSVTVKEVFNSLPRMSARAHVALSIAENDSEDHTASFDLSHLVSSTNSEGSVTAK